MTIEETVKNESRQKSTTGLSRKRYNKTKKRLFIGALNVRTFANRTDIMERKEVSKTSDKPIDKVPLLALELEANHIEDVCCLSEVRRDSCEFERERDINSTALVCSKLG